MSDPERADLSRLHVVIPVRSLGGGKARLGGALDAEEREALILGMLSHELNVVRQWGAARAVHVVSGDARVLQVAAEAAALPILHTPEGLNEAITSARAAAVADGASALLVLPADLPLLEVEALRRLLDAADAALAAGSGRPLVVLAPADARGGTNGLLLSPPDSIEPAFGLHSLEAHVTAAAAARATLQLVVDPAIGFDLDTPSDVDRLHPDTITRLEAMGMEASPRATVDGQRG